MTNNETGLRLASLLTAELKASGIVKDSVSFNELELVVYEELTRIGREQLVGDWLEMPDGTTYTLTTKPGRKL